MPGPHVSLWRNLVHRDRVDRLVDETNILLSFGGRGMALAVAGLGLGLMLTVAATRFLSTLLYGFTPDYLPAVAAASAVL